jgi:hypothetical protein
LADRERPDGDEREENGDDMVTETAAGSATTDDDTIVQFGGRIPNSLRRRARMCAAAQDTDAQTLLRAALEEYLTKRGF